VVVAGIVVVVVLVVDVVDVVGAALELHAEMIRTMVTKTATRRIVQPPKQHRPEGGPVNVPHLALLPGTVCGFETNENTHMG
jgi:hypothetical protein